jgi:hypothetical protein
VRNQIPIVVLPPLTLSCLLFPGMLLLLVLEVVARPADVVGEEAGVVPEGPEVGVADEHYVCLSQRMAAATSPLSRHFQLFILVVLPFLHFIFVLRKWL